MELTQEQRQEECRGGAQAAGNPSGKGKTGQTRTGVQVMAKLIGLVRPLFPVMVLAVLLGVSGFLCAIFLNVFGAEALARWTCGKYGSISPGEFIPLLERSGLINQLGRWIFSQAAAQCGKWRRYRPDFRMSINVSYHQLRKGDIVPDMLKKLEQFAMPPSSLTLELTESYFMKEEESRENVLDKLHGAGFTLAMDDFGMGYSSLLSLKNIPVDVVKIDRGFVKGITEDRFNAIFIGAITELCHNVGKQVCLEGVETEEEYRAVRDTGLELIQGFYFGLPVAAEEFERQWLSREL